MPELYSYTDYRSFLRDFYLEKKKKSPSYSFRNFAAKAQLRSPNYLKLVIDGQRRLTDRHLSAFLKGLGLEGKEALYFRLLTEWNNETEKTRKNDLARRLQDIRIKASKKPTLVHKERIQILEKWSHWVIRELVHLKDFQLDIPWIAARLQNKLSHQTIQESIDLLFKYEFLTKDFSGNVNIGTPLICSSDEQESLLIQNLHKQLISLSLDSLTNDPLVEREFGAVTLALPSKNINRAKEMIKKFRREFHMLLSEDSSEADQIYQLNIGFFPITKSLCYKPKGQK